MKRTIKFFSRRPSAMKVRTFSTVPTADEYTKSNCGTGTAPVAQQSEDTSGIAELAAKVDALTDIVNKLTIGKIDSVGGVPAVVQNSSEGDEPTEGADTQADANVEDTATEPTVTETVTTTVDDQDVQPEGIPEANLGAEVPANNGEPYTAVPEDDIVAQFSRGAGTFNIKEASNGADLMGKESFSCLF